MDNVKRFSDFADKENLPLDGAKMRIDDVLNREILITGLKIRTSRFKQEKQDDKAQCLTLQFQVDGRTCILFTGSVILSDQIHRYQAEVPFLTTIKKIDRYYTFS